MPASFPASRSALPVSVALGAPISTAILGLDGFLGYAGWKWIYILEAIPTVLIGVFVLFALTDKPAKASWLTAEEKDWLVDDAGAVSGARWNRPASSAFGRR